MRPPSNAARYPSRPALPPLAVTLGDPAGIGPDITLMSWRGREAHRLQPFVVYGSAEVLRERAAVLGLDVPIVPVKDMEQAAQRFPEALPVLQPVARKHAGARGDAAGQDAEIIAAIEDATHAALTGAALALVTNPIAKKS